MDSFLLPTLCSQRLMSHSNPSCAVRCITLSIALFVAAGAAAVPTANAQPAKERHTILVRPQGGACMYEITGQANQDLFVVRPNGAVILRAQEGLWVDASVEDVRVERANGQRSVPGAQNRRSFALRPRTPQDAFTVRGQMGQTTEHRVRIQCCANRDRGQGCLEWQDAQPFDPSAQQGGGGSAFLLRPDAGTMLRGPAAPPAPPVPLPPGGPVMRVEEEQ